MHPVPAARVEALRRFNRLYTRRIGVLREGLLGSPFSLTEVRVLYELAHRQELAATDLARELGIDAGYLSRILRGFRKRGFLARRAAARDRRRSLLTLKPAGHRALAPLEERSRAEAAALLSPLAPSDQALVQDALATVERLLGGAEGPSRDPAEVVLRDLRPGDAGWIAHRHGVLYAREWGYDQRFEAVVARIMSDFVLRFDPTGERCWIAEWQGSVVGSVLLVRRSRTVAKLRVLLVEPGARGLGVGRRLVAECVRFARDAGYRKITLWTHQSLRAARHLYEEAGFRCVGAVRGHSFGQDLVDETWELDLVPTRRPGRSRRSDAGRT
jgi:DNA-binding MarR family transcriptional regulator/predicted N-acetyltransferase YhbS